MPHADEAVRRDYMRRYRAQHADRLKAQKKQYRLDNIERHKAKDQAYYLANRDRRIEWQKDYYLANREARKAYDLLRRLKNPAYQARRTKAYRAKSKERIREANRRWRSANKELVRLRGTLYCNKRRALKKRAAVGTNRTAYAAFVKRVRGADAMPCYWCGRRTAKARRHVDHIVPLARGGKDDVANLCCACEACNKAKGSRLPEEYNGQALLF